MSGYVRNTGQIHDLLDRIHSTIAHIAPPTDIKAALSFTASLLALYLLQSMTWEAGIHSVTAVLRLIQRVSLGLISCVLMLTAAAILADENPHSEALSVLFLIPFLTMLGASAVLVHRQNHPKNKAPSGRPRNWIFGSRGPIR